MNYLSPDYIFESSWEVCNKVGGIYAVLSTRARTLQSVFPDKLFFIGPDIWEDSVSQDFIPTDDFAEWVTYAKTHENLSVKVGRWNVCGRPFAILVDFRPFFTKKDEIYGDFWKFYGVESLQAYGDYDESSMFGYATGAVIKSFHDFYHLDKKRVVAHFNEWMSAFGLFYLKSYLPQVATLFTTHATSIGRSIAGNDKPLYDYLSGYNGDQMARELNMSSKHSVEKTAAHLCDAFTTVSDITNKECAQLLEKPADVVTPNGFEPDFVPQGKALTTARKLARERLTSVAENLLDYKLSKNPLFVGISGRYEFKNKGLDVFIEAMKQVNDLPVGREIVAFIMVPAWSDGKRGDLAYKIANHLDLTIANPFYTHRLVDSAHDKVMQMIYGLNYTNQQSQTVKIIFVPSYLNGKDGIFNMSYYDLLVGFDLTIFPSYYEPWGYTPLESAAFGIPTITTDLSGFGQWVSPHPQSVANGVGVVHRTDGNYHEVVADIRDMVADFAKKTAAEQNKIGSKVSKIASRALWEKFIKYYYQAYDIALRKVITK